MNRPYEPCKELFFKYVPCMFLSYFEQQWNSCCLHRSTSKSHYTSCYLQYLNMWQSPSKQHNSKFDVLDHKEKRMVGNELSLLRHLYTRQHNHRSWEERRKTQQMLTAPPFACSDCLSLFLLAYKWMCYSLCCEIFCSHSGTTVHSSLLGCDAVTFGQ
jgi:hypothetical protein